MSFLDDLKKKAEAVQSAEQQAMERAKQLEDAYRTQISPKMKMIFSYLSDFIEQMKVVQMDIRVDYEYKGFCVRKGMRQGQYKIYIDSTTEPRKIHLKFQCEADEEIKFEIRNNDEVERIRNYFFDHQIQYRLNPIKDDRGMVIGGTFFVSKVVLIDFLFVAHMESSTIVILVNNFEGLTKQRLTVDPDKITGEFLDNLLKYIARASHDFGKLEISEDERRQIRENLRKQEVRKEVEHKQMEEQARKDAEAVTASKKESGLSKLLGCFKKD